MSVYVPKPNWWTDDTWKCWGQHGSAALNCWCGNARAPWLRRAAAHADGRHSRPQVDCWVCWQVGRFQRDPEAPPHDHDVSELCGMDCDRYWWEKQEGVPA